MPSQSGKTRVRVTVVLDVDSAAWELEYGSVGREAIAEMVVDAEAYAREAFTATKWDGLAVVEHVVATVTRSLPV